MQASWSGGYAADTPYLPTYLSAQAPAEMEAVCALAGVHFGLKREGLKILDLGCGRGVAVLAQAAANPSWTAYGIDYMPSHIDEAREIADAAGLDNAHFLETDLATIDEAAAAQLLPELDVITLHGVWTWVSDAVRQGIVRLIRSRLKPGGLVLVTYNVMAGWADDLALQRLLRDMVGVLEGPRNERMAQALEIARTLHAAGAAALQDSFFLNKLVESAPASREAFARYAVHEFLTDHWRPTFPQDVAAAMDEAKLSRVGPATLAMQFAAVLLPAEQRDAAAALPGRLDAQFGRDLFVKPSLHQELYMRGPRAADPKVTLPALPLALRLLPQDGRVLLDTPNGTAELPPAVTGAALGALAQRPQTLGTLMALPEMARTTPGELLAVLVGSRVAAPVWRATPTAEMRSRAMRYNTALLQHLGADAQAMGGELALAVPMLGSGSPAAPVEIATLLALAEAACAGRPAPEPATIARGMLVAESSAEAMQWTEEAVTRTLARRVPAWKVLGLL